LSASDPNLFRELGVPLKSAMEEGLNAQVALQRDVTRATVAHGAAGQVGAPKTTCRGG